MFRESNVIVLTTTLHTHRPSEGNHMLSVLMSTATSMAFISVTMGAFLLLSVAALWRGWGVDMHRDLEEKGIAYDQLHPEDRADQERRAAES